MKNLKEKLNIVLKTLFDNEDKNSLYKYIFDNYYKRINYFIKTIYPASRDNSVDITQEILIKIYKNIDKYDFRGSFSTWVYTIARNTCIDYQRKNRITIIETFKEPEHPLKITDQIMEKELKSLINNAIKKLDRKDQEIIYLFYFENMKYKEISKITSKPVGTLKFRMHSIKKKLKIYLEDYYDN